MSSGIFNPSWEKELGNVCSSEKLGERIAGIGLEKETLTRCQKSLHFSKAGVPQLRPDQPGMKMEKS